MKLRIKSTSLTLKIISWIQIIGGVTGIGFLAYLLMNTETVNGPTLLIFLIGLSLFIYSIYTGIRLLNDKDKTAPILHTLFNQFLQLFQWSLLGYGFSYLSGAGVLVGLKGASLVFNFSFIESSYNMSINAGDGKYFITINILAGLIILVMFDVLKEVKREKIELLAAGTEPFVTDI